MGVGAASEGQTWSWGSRRRLWGLQNACSRVILFVPHDSPMRYRIASSPCADVDGGIRKDRAPCAGWCRSVRGTGMGDRLWRGAPEKDAAQGWHWGAGPHLIQVHPHRYCCSRPAGWKNTCIFRYQLDSLITRVFNWGGVVCLFVFSKLHVAGLY